MERCPIRKTDLDPSKVLAEWGMPALAQNWTCDRVKVWCLLSAPNEAPR
jgi:hypothetical protein